ncbi:MAG: hypothetical protein KJO07_10725, partial [Deltaproteobacteria bacterium]|nr:hypothetical protein [Deltaproteobacteria bacterium]
PGPYGSLYNDVDAPVTTTVHIDDPDSTSLSLSVEAVRGTERISLAENLLAGSGNNDVTWDPAVLSGGSGWTLIATVSDGATERRARVSRITISHQSTTLGWSDVSEIFASKCAICHFGRDASVAPGLAINLGDYQDSDGDPGVFSSRGHIYQRVVLQATMPPVSAKDIISTYEMLTDEERELLEDWLEGGAPQ